jgi:hypothetical protein
MSNPNKKWSWGAAMGRGVGGIVGGGGAGAVMGSMGGPAGVALAAAVGAAGGFVSGITGALLGHLWDDPPLFARAAGSDALYMCVVSGTYASLLWALVIGHLPAERESLLVAIFALTAFPGFLASMSLSLIDDIAARRERERERTF